MARSGRKWVKIMFMGEYQHNIDAKGRIIVPVKFREELGESMIVTRGLDGCLTIYTPEQWQQVVENLKKLPSTKREVRMYTHMLMAKAAECDLDSMGRIRIPAHLTKEAQLEKHCIIVGVNDHIEIWDQVKWEEYYSLASENYEDVAESLTEFFS